MLPEVRVDGIFQHKWVIPPLTPVFFDFLPCEPAGQRRY
jgi:hypothetical protein